MDECTQGKLNQQKLEAFTKEFAERNTEIIMLRKDVHELQIDNATMKKDIKHICEGVGEIKKMIQDDQVDRNRKREQVETNKKDIEVLKSNETRQYRMNITCVLAIISAAVKIAFFDK